MNVFCLSQSLLTEVVQKAVDAHVHRVYVLNELSHPVGIITITDILAFIVYKLFT